MATDQAYIDDQAAPRALRRARAWANLLDDRFEIAGFRFGFDGILGLIPGVGALVTFTGGIVMLTSAHELGLSAGVKAKIVGYTLFDAIVGAVPLIGDVFDFLFKSHKKSLEAIEKALDRRPVR